MASWNAPGLVGVLFLISPLFTCHGMRIEKRNFLNSTGPTSDKWKVWMQNPPAEALAAYAKLASEADAAVEKLIAHGVPTLGDVDVVYSGGGNLESYAIGVDMVLSRLQAKTQGGKVQVKRYSGTSAGGMLAFDVVLTGEKLSVASKIALHMLLQSKWMPDQAKYEKQKAEWMTEAHASELSKKLDDKVYLALNCIFQWKPLTIVHKYTSPKQARQAYLVTGGMGTYEGKSCVDGGSVSGKHMTPLFQEGMRPQIIVNLMAWGDGLSGVLDINADRFQDRIRTGMNDAVDFLQSQVTSIGAIATSHNKGITFCPSDAKVKDNVCKDKNASPWWR